MMGRSETWAKGVDYCRSCDGYTAEVGKMDQDGWCERCCYRNVLTQIADDPAVSLDVRSQARQVLAEWEN